MTGFGVIINQVMPILLLIFLGNRMRAYEFISEQTVEELKKLVVNIALPAVLFVSFSTIDLKWSYLTLSVIIFVTCVLLLIAGFLFKKIIAPKHPYFPHLTSGFEYGMLGVTLFGSGYGMENIGYIAVVDLGHELYIWFILAPLLMIGRDGGGNTRGFLKTFLTNPVVLSIVAGLSINMLGLGKQIVHWPLTGGVVNTLNILAGMVIPLILLIVGYGMRISLATLGESMKLIGFRYALVLPVLLFLNIVVIRGILGLERPFEIALTTLFLMPSPFIVPLFMSKEMVGEKEYVNNILATQSAITICIFSIYLIFTPTL